MAAMALVFVAASAHAKAGAVQVEQQGDVSHTGTDGSECEADATTHGKSKATAKTDGSAEAISESHGKSTAIATGEGTADATSDEHATASAKAGRGHCGRISVRRWRKVHSVGDRIQQRDGGAQLRWGGLASAHTTNGGTAQAFDDAPPLCSPGPPPGTATVKYSGGDC